MDYKIQRNLVYKLLKDLEGNTNNIQATTEDGLIMIIPIDEANTDYQEYIAWTKASPKNVPKEADNN